ncbi:MAG: FecR family protein [Proteobacteria bacterium]|nr:FecR family protein [Pseudomonadota bacterium]
MFNQFAITVCILGLFHTTSFASNETQGAVVTRLEGEAKLLINERNQAKGQDLKPVVFEGERYLFRPLKKGDRPGNGDVISTTADSKVRLIFRNGDQVTVAPSTAYKFSWDSQTEKGAVANILYGDIRAVIQPGGPRSGMKVQTKSAVMGVRGTDFSASAWGGNGGSKVAVLRGKVAVTSMDNEGQSVGKEAEILAGSTGVVTPVVSKPKNEKAVPPHPEIEIKKTSKEELIVIQTDSKVQKGKLDGSDDKDLGVEIAKLEIKAVETTLEDIKLHDKVLYKEMAQGNKSKTMDVDEIQAETVKKIFVLAPEETRSGRKPSLQDLESGGDAYERFKWKKSDESL